MDKTKERRREERLRYQWPVWFAEDFKKTISQGLMVDVSSGGVAFTCSADENCPHVGQKLTTRFSIPRFGSEDSSAKASFTRIGRVCRVDNLNSALRRVAIQFEEPLSLKPGEEAAINLMRSEA